MLKKQIINTFNLLICFLLFACAAPKVKTTSLVPAYYNDAAKLKKIAVLPFEGPGGRAFATELEGTLGGIRVGGNQFFVLVDRQRIDNVIREQRLSLSGLLEADDTVRLGKILGAKGIFTGNITVSDVSDRRYREERQECIQRERKTGKNGAVWEGNCLWWRKYYVSCTRRDAAFSVTPKIIDVETGIVKYTNNIVERTSATACDDSNVYLISKQSLLDTAKKKALNRIQADIAPHYVIIEIKLMDSTDGMDKDEKQLFKSGLSLVKKNRIDRACELWEEALGNAPKAPSLVYNVAFCAEVQGNLEKSFKMYQQVDRLLLKPDDRTSLAIKRISEKIRSREKLNDQMGK